MDDAPIKRNKILWDRLADVHMEDPWYKVEPFLKGESTLMPPELKHLKKVKDKSLLHLQCHFGLDSLSLARMGAQVTGVDLSDRAIFKARELADQLELDAQFVCSPLAELKSHLSAQFDIVFTSYGVLDWLPDLDYWAHLIEHYLKPGGQFILVEFHPLLNCFNLETGALQYPYFGNRKPISEQMEKSYTGTSLGASYEANLWAHELGVIHSSLLNAGLQITHFQEYDFTPYNCLPHLIERARNEFVWAKNTSLPLLFSIVAEKSE